MDGARTMGACIMVHSFLLLSAIHGINVPNLGNPEIKDSSLLQSWLRKSAVFVSKERHHLTPQFCLLQVQS